MEFKEKTRPEKFAANLFDALFCRRDVDAVDAETRPVTFVSLFRFATTRDIALFVLGCFFAVIGGALQPMVMILDGQITSLFLLPGEKKGNEAFVVGVTKWLTLIAVFGIVCFVFSFFETFLLRRVSANVGQRLRTEFVRAVLRQDAVYFDDTAAGAITAQLNENVAKIEDGLGDKVGMLLRGFSMFTTSVAYCFSVNWQITVIAVSMGPLSSVTLGLMGTLLSSMTHKMMQTSSKASEVFEESVMNVKTIASCNAQEHMVKKYFRTLSEGISTVKTYNFWVGFFTGLSLYQILVLAGLSLWYGVHAFHSGLVGNAASVIMIIDTVCVTSYYLSLLGPHTMAIVKARVAAAVLYSTIKKDPTNDGNRNVEKITGRVVFDNIYFRYPNRDHLVLKGINWACEPGESVAFVGSSGCGKSTLISLITKLRSATAGKITIDGTSIEEFSVGSLRRLIGIVEQEPTLFNGTIMENIRLDRDDVSEEDAMQAAAISEAHGFIENLSEGYNTPIGDRGVQLSGGQKQRIAIARAIATNPKILLLDEATSALDSQSESVVQQALERASEGRATIAVTHRLSTLKYFDCIHVIHDGIIVEAGTHEELMELKGVYEKLAKGQGLEKSLPKRAATLRKRHQRVSTISTTPTSCAKEDSDAESEIEDEQERREMSAIGKKMPRIKHRKSTVAK